MLRLTNMSPAPSPCLIPPATRRRLVPQYHKKHETCSTGPDNHRLALSFATDRVTQGPAFALWNNTHARVDRNQHRSRRCRSRQRRLLGHRGEQSIDPRCPRHLGSRASSIWVHRRRQSRALPWSARRPGEQTGLHVGTARVVAEDRRSARGIGRFSPDPPWWADPEANRAAPGVASIGPSGIEGA